MSQGRTLAAIAASTLIVSNAYAAGTPDAPLLPEHLGLPVTNSMLTSWVISLLIIVAVRLAVKKPQLMPSKGQLVVEGFVDSVRGLIEPIVGKHMIKPTFWLLSGLFMYIMMHNWSGLLPGVGTIGWGVMHDGVFHVTKPLIRPANADLNMTAALATVATVAWLFFILKYAGLKTIAYDIFGNKADRSEVPGIMYIMLTFIFLFVGLIEIISIVLRPITLSFRLFGNVFGGEELLHNMYGIFYYVVPIPFYFLELLVGLVQALVFTLLVSVYIGLICNHDGGEGHH